MRTLEMKAIASEKLVTINEEAAIKKRAHFLENLSSNTAEFHADKFFKNAREKYADLLQKLAE